MLISTLESPAPVAILRITGTLTLHTTVEVRSALQKALTDHPSAMVVDLSGITLEDEIAATVFAAFARAAAAWPGCQVLLAAPDGKLREQLERMAIDRVTPIFAERDAAINAAVSVRAPRQFLIRLVPRPAAAADARNLVATAFKDWGFETFTDDAELIMTELISNAVRHAGPRDLEVGVMYRDSLVHMSVRDGSRLRPRRRTPDSNGEEGGRGLLLLDALASGWGSTLLDDGKVVWATVRVRGGRRDGRPASAS